MGDKSFLYEALPDGDFWMYYSIDEKTCVMIKLHILGAYDAEGNGIDVTQSK